MAFGKTFKNSDIFKTDFPAENKTDRQNQNTRHQNPRQKYIQRGILVNCFQRQAEQSPNDKGGHDRQIMFFVHPVRKKLLIFRGKVTH